MSDNSHLLSDAQMAEFIAHGYITVALDLPANFHREVFAQHEEVFEKEGNPGNNVLPRIPLVGEVFSAPIVQGALRSVVGDDYYLQPHRHPHYNPSKSKGQNMHQDGGKRWSHRTRYLLAFYYPQDTPIERGPSGIVPGSHYFSTPEGARISAEIPLVGAAGTVTIANYDLWHRQMPNHTEDNRYMVKFLFARMSEPQAPSWDNQQSTWPGVPAVLDGDGEELQKMYEQTWHWHCGRSMPPATNGHALTELLAALAADQERLGLAAAYALAAYGESAVEPLLERLADESEMTRHHAAYALSAIGAPAVQSLGKTLEEPNPVTRALAAEILGDIGLGAEAAIPALMRAAADAEVQVRLCAIEALGTVCQAAPTAVPALIEALADEDMQVRQKATLALARLGPWARDAVEALESVLEDENRYVRGDALHALERIGTADAKDTLIRHLMPARWCPLTSAASTF
jgi:HEAT repeat protein